LILCVIGTLKFHQDGFPTRLACKNGEQVLRDFFNYAKINTLIFFLWDSTAHFNPAGEWQIPGGRFPIKTQELRYILLRNMYLVIL